MFSTSIHQMEIILINSRNKTLTNRTQNYQNNLNTMLSLLNNDTYYRFASYLINLHSIYYFLT